MGEGSGAGGDREGVEVEDGLMEENSSLSDELKGRRLGLGSRSPVPPERDLESVKENAISSNISLGKLNLQDRSVSRLDFFHQTKTIDSRLENVETVEVEVLESSFSSKTVEGHELVGGISSVVSPGKGEVMEGRGGDCPLKFSKEGGEETIVESMVGESEDLHPGMFEEKVKTSDCLLVEVKP